MPLPAAMAAALVSAGGNLASQGVNAFAQGKMNKKTRRWNEKMYQLQRQDSLADWAMQNEYNHPSAQMARLRESGLNPNLVYGNGADATSGPVRSTEVQAWRPEAAQFDLGSVAASGLGSYYDTQIKQAQIDNLRTQNTVMETERLAKLASIDLTRTNTRRGEFQLALDNQLKDITVSTRQANLDKTLADTKYTLDQNERAQAQNASSLLEAAERILRSRAERANLPAQRQLIYAQIGAIQRDSQLKELDINLKKKGIQPSDNLALRMLGQIVNQTPGELRDKYGLKLLDKYQQHFKDTWKNLQDTWKKR